VSDGGTGSILEERAWFENAHTDIASQNSLINESHYPAAQCAMVKIIHMYHQTSSAAVEVANVVNMECHQNQRTVIDLLNAAILLIKMECKRIQKQKGDCW